ncbi:MAG: hypothetical protein MUF49_21140, partial [Oculatellaceae cyanobacterium Prado106]|nr:hypothetical protein [Oculatellaceae cyanobacterium Prado106]
FGSVPIIGGLDLGDLFKGLSRVNFNDIQLDKIDLGDFFDGIGSFFQNLIGRDFKVDKFLNDFGDIDLIEGIKLDNLFGGLENMYLPVFGGVKVGDFMNVIDSLDVVDKQGNVDLLGGVGSVINALGDSGFLENFVVDNLLFGGVGGIAGQVVRGLVGDDFMTGSSVVKRLLGRGGDDLLSGGLGSKILNGGAGNDFLIAGKGGDTLIGGKGRNNFVVDLVESSGAIVKDFSSSLDKIMVLGKVDFRDLDIRQSGRDAIVSVGRQDIVTVKNVDDAILTAGKFIFI